MIAVRSFVLKIQNRFIDHWCKPNRYILVGIFLDSPNFHIDSIFPTLTGAPVACTVVLSCVVNAEAPQGRCRNEKHVSPLHCVLCNQTSNRYKSKTSICRCPVERNCLSELVQLLTRDNEKEMERNEEIEGDQRFTTSRWPNLRWSIVASALSFIM